MKRHVLTLVLALLAPALGWAQQRGLNLQATPRESPLLPVPPTPPRGGSAPTGLSYDLAPTPNRDLDGPQAPRASRSPELAPSLFNREQQYRGDGFSAGSSPQVEQERRLRPGAGFKLRLPLQQE